VHGHHTHEHSHEEETHNHEHNGMHEIGHIVSDLRLPQSVKNNILAVYKLIGEAESYVHGTPVEDIHFHEVGTLDAITDITMVCMLINKLAPKEIVASPIHVGSGHVKCAHGILPVPAPATVYLLKDIPIYGGGIKSELCTPTGAALLKHFVTRFGEMPVMTVKAIGYGMGKKDFTSANCLRVLFGETEDKTDKILELSCNLDDMTAEEIGFATERLFEGGAVEVYTMPIGMKKSRPGTLINVLCSTQDKEKMISLIFLHTTTIGIRETEAQRYILERYTKTLKTPYGEVRYKESEGYGVTRSKYEYEDVTRIAREQNISMDKALELIEECL